jgi:predicted O-methyltransferase YrrM
LIGRNPSTWLLVRLGVRRPETQTSDAERACLERHARGRQRIVEIGVYHGVNTALFRRIVDEAGEVVGIDPHPPGRLGVSFERWIAERELSRVRRAKARLIRQFSHEAATNWNSPIDFLFIDGDHSWDGISRDWSDWTAHVVAGGIVALHDSRPVTGRENLDSVRFASDVALADPRFDAIEAIDSLTILRRRTTAAC